jgi:hypothetical protein
MAATGWLKNRQMLPQDLIREETKLRSTCRYFTAPTVKPATKRSTKTL